MREATCRRSRSPRRATARACTSRSTMRVDDIVPWTRSQRLAVRSAITIPHLLASSAIPFVFPAVALTSTGTPNTAATARCARRRRSRRRCTSAPSASSSSAPAACTSRPASVPAAANTRTWRRSPATRCRTSSSTRSRSTSSGCSGSTRRSRCCRRGRARETSLKPIDVLVIAPSERLDDIAAEHLGSLPLPIRAHAARRRRLGQGRRCARRGARELSAVRGAVYARADGARRQGHDGARRRGARVLRLASEAPAPRVAEAARPRASRRRSPAA